MSIPRITLNDFRKNTIGKRPLTRESERITQPINILRGIYTVNQSFREKFILKKSTSRNWFPFFLFNFERI